ncbi:Uncharacterized membrane protein [Paenibacillus sp. 1_12]|uniref:DMT family transporter n=1 Tax=Paenibacillus sp. 1_12 TaxID=1566278 RepID=UPI0008ECD4BE|nr:DMT family transporter [Paenibacillus sp. 1_12]SFL11887.1 Uncharacterized membrane protein [Paenibacillus sp. 1_12]
MHVIALLLVLLSGMLHAVWNLFAKKSVNKSVFLWLAHWVGTIVFLPGAWYEWGSFAFTIKSMGLLAGSMFIHGLYLFLLARTYQIGDLSQAYPIMRGISPIIVPLVAVLLLGETMSSLGWVCILAIIAGIVWVSGGRALFRQPAHTNHTLLLAGAVGICVSGYIVVDKITIESIPPIVLNEATNIANLLALTIAVIRSKGIAAEWKLNYRTIIIGGILAPGGYMLFLYALTLAPASQLAPMREIGTVFGTLFGLLLLNEPQGRSRIIGSVLITAGVIGLGFS